MTLSNQTKPLSIVRIDPFYCSHRDIDAYSHPILPPKNFTTPCAHHPIQFGIPFIFYIDPIQFGIPFIFYIVNSYWIHFPNFSSFVLNSCNCIFFVHKASIFHMNDLVCRCYNCTNKLKPCASQQIMVENLVLSCALTS